MQKNKSWRVTGLESNAADVKSWEEEGEEGEK